MCTAVLSELAWPHLFSRFVCPEPGNWSLSSRPSELLGALEQHAGRLSDQLDTEDVTSDLVSVAEDSVAVQLLSHCVDFAKTASRLAWYAPTTYSHNVRLLVLVLLCWWSPCLQLSRQLSSHESV